MASASHAPCRKALCILAALALTACLVPALSFASFPLPAHAADAINEGNPFENGDFVWNDNLQTYCINGLDIRVGDIREISMSGTYLNPFPYPKCFAKAYELYQNKAGGGNYEGWGKSTFQYGYVNVVENARGINFTDLPTQGYCAQRSNNTTVSMERGAMLMLVSEQSHWDGGTYHGCFLLKVDNGWQHGIWDQATIGNAYVHATWQLPGTITLQKSVSASDAAQDNPYCSLEGARYGVYRSSSDAQAQANAVETLTTGSDGKAQSGDLAAGTYYVREIAAPAGYVLDEQIYEVTVNAGQDTVVDVKDAPIQGGVRIQKTDRETGGDALGSASLEGAVFRIVNKSEHAVYAEGAWRKPGETVATIPTDAQGIAQTAPDALSYGRYAVEEALAPTGYLSTEAALEFEIAQEGQVAELLQEEGFQNQVRRGDLAFNKKDQATGTAMANVAFRITSQTTGESHVVVTDANGYLSTSAQWNPHSVDTNANDTAEDGSYNPEAGVWFGEGSTPDDSLGALPFDTYLIEELPCAANEGRQLITQEDVIVSRHNVEIDLGTIDDPQASIGTLASDAADDDRIIQVGEEACVIDRVAYAGLVPGKEYRLQGWIADPETESPLTFDNSPIEASATFTPESPNGTVEVRFAIPADLLAQFTQNDEQTAQSELTGVVFEELYDDSGRLIASHKDPTDSGQTIRFTAPASPEPEPQPGPEEPPVTVVPPGEAHDQTGFNAMIVPAIAIAAALGAAALTVGLGMRRHASGSRSRSQQNPHARWWWRR